MSLPNPVSLGYQASQIEFQKTANLDGDCSPIQKPEDDLGFQLNHFFDNFMIKLDRF